MAHPTATLFADVPSKSGQRGRFIFVLEARELCWYHDPSTPLSKRDGQVALAHIRAVEEAPNGYTLIVEKPRSGAVAKRGLRRSPKQSLYHLQATPTAGPFFSALKEAVRQQRAEGGASPSSKAVFLANAPISDGITYEKALTGRAFVRPRWPLPWRVPC